MTRRLAHAVHRQFVNTAAGNVDSAMRRLGYLSEAQRAGVIRATRSSLAGIINNSAGALGASDRVALADEAASRVSSMIDTSPLLDGIGGPAKDVILDVIRRHARGAAKLALKAEAEILRE